jgi:peptide/nickel transport system ATP-binding protein
VSLTVQPGETLGLVGESGSGKSLTALSVVQLLPPGAEISGSVTFEDGELIGLKDRALRKIRGAGVGMVFQEPMTALNPLHTVGRQIAEVFTTHTSLPRAERYRRLLVLLERVGLSPGKDYVSRYPHELSGGQRQRVGIAVALALRPQLVIADEPTTALDVTTQAQILRLLKTLVAGDNASLLLISHDLAVVAEMADSIAVMKNGVIIEHQETGALFAQPAHRYTRELIRAHILPKRVAVPASAAGEKAPAGAPILEARGVSHSYPDRSGGFFGFRRKIPAVRDVSLCINPGERIGLVGESGCGKSTLTRILLGLERPRAGAVLFRGRDIRTLDRAGREDYRRQVQVVFQDSAGSFNPRLKSGFSVAEPLRLLKKHISKADWDARILQSFIEVGLHAEDAEKYPHEFSGGQRQRLSLARALILRPSLVLLDEPVSALDGPTRAQIVALLAELQKRRNLAYLFVSHDLNVVRAVTDRVLVMRKGVFVEQGETAQVLESPAAPYTRELIEASPDLEDVVFRRFSTTVETG